MGGRLDVGEVELPDLPVGLQDRSQLVADAVDLPLRNLQPRELCDVENVFLRYRHGTSQCKSLEIERAPIIGARLAVSNESLDQPINWTFAACRPLSPCTTSNSTRWPSWRDL